MVNKYKKIRPLVIGIGVAGKRHLEAQLNLGIKTGIYTTNPKTARSQKDRNNVIVFDNLEKGIDWSNLVHVCTPDDKHTEFVAAALKKRKAVLCEKSFTTNLKDALTLQALAHKYNCPLFVGQNYRLTPTFLKTKKRVSQGKLGKITHIEITYFHDYNDYKRRYPNVNFLYMGGSHAVDLACWIAGEPVVSIQAASRNPLKYQIILNFAFGLKGIIKLDASSPRPISGTDLIVYGEMGKLISHNKIGKLNTSTFTIPKEVKIVDDYLSGKNTSHWPLPQVDEAVNTIKVLDAIQRAVSSGRNETVGNIKDNCR